MSTTCQPARCIFVFIYFYFLHFSLLPLSTTNLRMHFYKYFLLFAALFVFRVAMYYSYYPKLMYLLYKDIINRKGCNMHCALNTCVSIIEQDRMSTDAIEGLRDSQDLDDWQYNDDSYIHLPSQCRYSNIHFAQIFKYP